MSQPTLGTKLLNTGWTTLCTQSNAVRNASDLYIGELKQPLHKHKVQHRRANSTEQDTAVHLHLKGKGHSFEDGDVHILAKEDRWFERGVKEITFVNLEQLSLNRGGGLRHNLSATYNTVLRSIPRRLNTRLKSQAPNDPHYHNNRTEKHLTRGDNNQTIRGIVTKV